MLFIVGKGYIRYNRLADTDMELIFRFFLRHCAHIYRNVFEYQRSLALCLRHIVRRLAGNDAGNVLAQRISYPYLMGRYIAGHPAAQGDNAEVSVRTDCLYHESNLITVSVQLYHRTVSFVFFAVNIKIAKTVFFEFSQSFCMSADLRHHIILKSRCAVGIGNIRNQFQILSLIHFHRASLIFLIRYYELPFLNLLS